MRSREKIEQRVDELRGRSQQWFSNIDTQACLQEGTIEVLLDIRDLLEKINSNTKP